jgi:hypothetical protein
MLYCRGLATWVSHQCECILRRFSRELTRSPSRSQPDSLKLKSAMVSAATRSERGTECPQCPACASGVITESWVLRSTLHFRTTILLWSDEGVIFTRHSGSRVPTVGRLCPFQGRPRPVYSPAHSARRDRRCNAPATAKHLQPETHTTRQGSMRQRLCHVGTSVKDTKSWHIGTIQRCNKLTSATSFAHRSL